MISEQIQQKPLTENDIDIIYEDEDHDACHESQMLMNIITTLLNLIRHDSNYNVKLTRVVQLLTNLLNIAQEVGNKGKVYDQLLTLKNNINANKTLDFNEVEEQSKTYYKHHRGERKKQYTKVAFKYEIARINQPTCKQAFLKLMHTAYEKYIHLAKLPTCEEIEEYEYPQSEIIHIPPIPLSYSERSHNEGMPTNTHGPKYKKLLPTDLFDLLVPKDETTHIHPYEEPIYQLPYSNLIPQHMDNHINNFFPKDPKEVFIRPESKIPKQENIQYLPNDYIIPHINGNFNPNYFDTDRLIGGNNLDFMHPNNKDQDFDRDSPRLFNADLKIPSNINNHIPEDNPLSYLLEDILNTKKYKPQYPPMNKKLPIFNNADYDKPQEINVDPYIHLKPYKLPWINNNTRQMKDFDRELPNVDIVDTPLPKEIIELILKFPQQKEYILKKYYLSGIHNPTFLDTDDYHRKINGLISSVANLNKMNSTINTQGEVELTYVVKRPIPIIYYPLYYVKYRLPINAFVESVQNILKYKPYLRADPVKLYKEIITISNVSETSLDLEGFPRDKIVQLTYSNGHLVNTQIFPHTDLSLNINKQWLPIYKVKDNVDTGEILNLNKDLGEGNFWKTFKAISDRANYKPSYPINTQKRYKIVNSDPLFRYNTMYPPQKLNINKLSLPDYLKRQLERGR